MYREHSVGVVVPAYNEAGFVGEVVETLPEYVDRIYVVDDCSTDGTWAEIQRAAGRDPSGDGRVADSDRADATASDVDGASARSDADATAGGSRSDRSDAGAASNRDVDPDVVVGDADGTVANYVDAGAAVREPPATDASATEASATGGESEAAATAGGSEASTADESASAREPSAEGSASTRSDGGAAARRVVPIRHAENRGVGGAIKTGYQRAREDEVDVTVVVGGDGQMDPDVMPRLLDPVVEGRADYAKGNRLLEPEHHEEMPTHRVVGNGILTALTKIATGYWQVGDPQMGYTAISLEALEEAAIDEMYEYFGYCNDLLVRLSTVGCRVADVPCPLGYGDEESHISYGQYVPRVSLMLLGSFLRRIWTTKGSAAGASRLGLFVGGAGATSGGLARVAVDALRGDDADADESGSGWGTTALVGVAALLLAMLVDAVANAPNNYTDRVPDDESD